MSFFKNKILPFFKRIKNFRYLDLFKRKKISKQLDIDKKLVYSLSPRKIPNSKQLKHLNRFLSKKEIKFLKILFFIFLASVTYYFFSVFQNKLTSVPTDGGTYIEGVVGYPKNVNPLYASGNDVDKDLSFLIYSSILKYNNNGKLVGDLVESFNIDKEGKNYTFKIKDNVYWHDGTKLTADDIVFTFNLIKNPEYKSPLRQAFIDVSIEKIDDLTIKFSLPEPYAPFLSLLTFGIMPKDLWSGYSPDSIILSDLNLKPIGSGPFKFKTLYKNKNGEIKEYELEVNNNYYGKKPYINEIKFEFFVDRQEAISALNNKQIMGLNYLPFEKRSELLAQNSLNIYDLIQPQTISLFFNEGKNEFLADKENRLWLEKSINKQEIVEEVFYNTYRPASGIYLEENPAHNDNINYYNYEPNEAKEYFSKAIENYLQKENIDEEEENNNEEVLENNNKKIELELTIVETEKNKEVAKKIQNYFKEVGIDLNIKMITGEQAANLITDKDFEILLYGQEIGGDPDIFSFWHSSQRKGKGLNIAGYNNAQVDKLLTQGRRETNQEVRMEKYKEIQEIFNIEVPAIFLYSPTYTYIQSRDLKGFSGNIIISPENRFNSVSDWYLKTKLKLSHD
jgi:peptide/nickel transport system substrate-binding protein